MLDHLITLLEREVRTVEQGILDGLCLDYTVYREQVAMRRAFHLAIELAQRSFREDEDDDGLS